MEATDLNSNYNQEVMDIFPEKTEESDKVVAVANEKNGSDLVLYLTSYNPYYSGKRKDIPSKYLINKVKHGRQNSIQDLEGAMDSSTVYVGNLNKYIAEERIFVFFSQVGTVKQIIMGLDRFHQTPTGFCFVIFENHREASNAVKFLAGVNLDGKPLEIDLDQGFTEGRQFGRGPNGGEFRTELRQYLDAERQYWNN